MIAWPGFGGCASGGAVLAWAGCGDCVAGVQ